MLVLHATDLDRPFVTYNAELLGEMLDPQLAKAVEARHAQRSTSEQVKWVLKRVLAGARPEIAAVARELGLSDRTLQRRIVDDGTTFRQLLLEARQESLGARVPHNRPEIDVTEVAYICLATRMRIRLYRASPKRGKGTTPAQLRSALSDDVITRQQMEGLLNKVWLITGSASGLGRNIAESVLESGDRLVATARDPGGSTTW